MKRIFVFILTALSLPALAGALPANGGKSGDLRSFDDFADAAKAQFDSLVNAADREYNDLLEQSWKEFEVLAGDTIPRWRTKPTPIEIKKEEQQRLEQDREWKIEIIETPRPQPTPEPAPRPTPQPAPRPVPIPQGKLKFDLYGSKWDVTDCPEVKLASTSNYDVSAAWTALNSGAYAGILNDCLELRRQKNLCDWLYMTMVHRLAAAKCPDNHNAASMLAGYILLNSDMQVKYALVDDSLEVMFACDAVMYYRSSGYMNDKRYYCFNRPKFSNYISYDDCGNVRGRPVDVELKTPLLDSTVCQLRTMSTHSGEPSISVSVCNGLMKFYSDYPSCAYMDNFVSRWAICARAPFSPEVQETFYPELRKAVEGKTPFEAVDLILSMCQNSLPYGYDDEIWGGDRAFYPEESLYYPKSDCEDHAIIFARIIKDILDYDVALIYVPEPAHVFAAVCPPAGHDIEGDYIVIGDRNYYICEPTVSGGHLPAGRCGSAITLDEAKAIDVYHR